MKDLVTIVTDGSYSDAVPAEALGGGFVTSEGAWGFTGMPYPAYHLGTERTQVAELQAILIAAEWLYDNADDHQHVLIYTDSLNALDYLRDWQRGSGKLPTSYPAKLHGEVTPLESFRRWVLANRDRVAYLHLPGGWKEPLHWGAHHLARQGLHRAQSKITEEDSERRAASVAEQALACHLEISAPLRWGNSTSCDKPADQLLAQVRGQLLARYADRDLYADRQDLELVKAFVELDTQLSEGRRLPRAWRNAH